MIAAMSPLAMGVTDMYYAHVYIAGVHVQPVIQEPDLEFLTDAMIVYAREDNALMIMITDSRGIIVTTIRSIHSS